MFWIVLYLVFALVLCANTEKYTIERHPNGDVISNSNCTKYTGSESCRCARDGTIYSDNLQYPTQVKCYTGSGLTSLGTSISFDRYQAVYYVRFDNANVWLLPPNNLVYISSGGAVQHCGVFPIQRIYRASYNWWTVWNIADSFVIQETSGHYKLKIKYDKLPNLHGELLLIQLKCYNYTLALLIKFEGKLVYVEDSGTSTSTTTESSTPSETTDISTSPTYTDTSTIWSRSPTPSYTTITSTKAMTRKPTSSNQTTTIIGITVGCFGVILVGIAMFCFGYTRRRTRRLALPSVTADSMISNQYATVALTPTGAMERNAGSFLYPNKQVPQNPYQLGRVKSNLNQPDVLPRYQHPLPSAPRPVRPLVGPLSTSEQNDEYDTPRGEEQYVDLQNNEYTDTYLAPNELNTNTQQDGYYQELETIQPDPYI